MAEYYDVDRITYGGDTHHFKDYSMSGSVTTPSPIVSFPDGSPYPMGMQFAVNPVQAGSGDPSPSNVRPITGWTGANIRVSPTQDAQDATVYPITFPASAGTVYGGTVTVNPDGTGKLVVDRAYAKLTSESQLTDFSINEIYGPSASFDYATGIKRKDNLVTAVSSHMIGLSRDDRTAEQYFTYFRCHGSNSGNRLVLRAPVNSGITTVSELYNQIQGAEFVYVLETPTTYSLTPGQVLSLLNLNNVWSDTGDIQTTRYVRNTVPEMIRQDTDGKIAPVLSELTDTQAAMAIVVDGDVAPKNIANGQYVFVKNHSTLATGMYHATAAIADGANVTGNNVEADADGIANALNANLTIINRIALYNMIPLSIGTSEATTYSTTLNRKFTSPGKFVVISLLTSDNRLLASTTVSLDDFLGAADNFIRYVSDDNTKITLHCYYYSATTVRAYITNSNGHKFTVKMFSVGDPAT